MGLMKSARSLAVRLLATKFLSSAYLQLLAAGLLVSLTVPAVAWGPLAVDRAKGMPGPVERTAFVECRHVLPAAPLNVPDAPRGICEDPSPVECRGIIIVMSIDAPVFQSFHSSLLANRAPPSTR